MSRFSVLLVVALAMGAHADTRDELFRNEASSDILREKLLQDEKMVKIDTADAMVAKAVASASRSRGDVQAAAMAESARGKFLASVREAEARIPHERAELSHARIYADKRVAEAAAKAKAAKAIKDALEAAAKAKALREAEARAAEAKARREAEERAAEAKARREAEERAAEAEAKARREAEERAVEAKASKVLQDAKARKVVQERPEAANAPKDIGENIHPDGGMKTNPAGDAPADKPLNFWSGTATLLGGLALLLMLFAGARCLLNQCSTDKFQDGDLRHPIIATTGLE